MDDLMTSCGREVAQDQLVTASRIRAAVSSMLSRRTGHARFRRGPVVADQQEPSDQPSDLKLGLGTEKSSREVSLLFSASASASASSSVPSTTLTSVTAGGEGSVSNGRGAHVQLTPLASASAGNPRPPATQPVSAGALKNKRCHDRSARSENGDSRCHCSKKRKSRVKRIIRVPAISSRNADIPTDGHSWRKYGQKPIKSSPYPRGYYKCSTVRGCPARKHVERDPGEPAMLIVTYEGDHRHHGDDSPGAGAYTTTIII